jgi:hypothetical protein
MNLNRTALCTTLFAVVAFGQMTSAQDEPKKTTHQKVRTLTGCLDKPEKDSSEYQLTTKAGGTWEIKSDAVKMAPHVGHTVTITGVVSNATAHGLKEDTKAEAREHGIDKDSTEHGHMTVTGLKMVSDSCSR